MTDGTRAEIVRPDVPENERHRFLAAAYGQLRNEIASTVLDNTLSFDTKLGLLSGAQRRDDKPGADLMKTTGRLQAASMADFIMFLAPELADVPPRVSGPNYIIARLRPYRSWEFCEYGSEIDLVANCLAARRIAVSEHSDKAHVEYERGDGVRTGLTSITGGHEGLYDGVSHFAANLTVGIEEVVGRIDTVSPNNPIRRQAWSYAATRAIMQINSTAQNM